MKFIFSLVVEISRASLWKTNILVERDENDGIELRDNHFCHDPKCLNKDDCCVTKLANNI